MDILAILQSLILAVGITLGVGSSTFALTFFIAAMQDGMIDPSEKNLMRIVYFVLRIGMVLIAVGIIGGLLLGYAFTSVTLAQLILLVVILLNAVLMTKHMMPMKYGPVLAGSSWYGLFLVSNLPLSGVSIWTLVIAQIAFAALFYIVYTMIFKSFVPARP